MFKKLICVIICAAMLCSLTGCRFLKFDLSKEREPIDPAVSPSVYSMQVLNDMQDYMKDGDAENLHKLIAKRSRVTVEEVQGLLNFIDGDIVSFDKHRLQRNGGKKIDSKYTEYAYGGQFNILTDKEKEYICYFAAYAVCDEDPALVGLEKIVVTIENDGSIDGYGVGPHYNEKGQILDYNGNVTDW